MPDPTDHKPHDTALQWVRFEVGAQPYAIPLLAVQEIIRLKDIAKLPLSPAFMEGAINLRGNHVPVVDLRKRFGTKIYEHSGRERILIVEIEDDTRVVGLIVDEVEHVLSIDSDAIEPTSDASGNSAVEAIVTLDAGPLHLLSLQAILSQHELESALYAANSLSNAQAA